MTVADLIEFLKTQPQELPVISRMYSDYDLLKSDEIEVVEMCLPREDGWVQYKREDMPSQKYLCFPGN